MHIKNVHCIVGSEDEFIANTYIVVFENDDCLVVDPSPKNKSVLNFIEKNSLKLVGVLITHGHCDHIQGLPVILGKYPNVGVYVGRYDEQLLRDKKLNLSSLYEDKSKHLEIKGPLKSVVEGPISISNHRIQVFETPFHTIGGVFYYFADDGIVFTGDTLMKNCIGRFDLPCASPKDVRSTLNKIVGMIPDNTKIYAGHGEITTMEEEKKNNPFLLRFVGNKK